MKSYDYIFAGGGLAGLSLACQITRSRLRSHSMLIVDQDAKQQDDRTFSYWAGKPGPFDQSIYRSWNRLAFHAPGYSSSAPLGSYRYHTICSIDLYRAAHQELATCPNVEFLCGRIRGLEDTPQGAILTVDDAAEGQVFFGKWAFDSRPRLAEQSDPAHDHQLKLVFIGWDVEADFDAFDPQTPILMDFRTRQGEDVRFFYLLPFSERRALVEYTLFTEQQIRAEDCQVALRRYLSATLGLIVGVNCQGIVREKDCLLIINQPFPRKQGRHILAIGLRGGLMKPTSGYAFTRIQRDSAAIVHSLQNDGHPFNLPDTPPLYSQLDAFSLEAFTKHPDQVPGTFTRLFRKNPIERILRFLDEDISLVEINKLMFTMPPGLILRIMAGRKTLCRDLVRSYLEFRRQDRNRVSSGERFVPDNYSNDFTL